MRALKSKNISFSSIKEFNICCDSLKFSLHDSCILVHLCTCICYYTVPVNVPVTTNKEPWKGRVAAGQNGIGQEKVKFEKANNTRIGTNRRLGKMELERISLKNQQN